MNNKIAELIWEDLTDRSGCDFDFDDEVMEEIMEAWNDIINNNMPAQRVGHVHTDKSGNSEITITKPLRPNTVSKLFIFEE